MGHRGLARTLRSAYASHAHTHTHTHTLTLTHTLTHAPRTYARTHARTRAPVGAHGQPRAAVSTRVGTHTCGRGQGALASHSPRQDARRSSAPCEYSCARVGTGEYSCARVGTGEYSWPKGMPTGPSCRRAAAPRSARARSDLPASPAPSRLRTAHARIYRRTRPGRPWCAHTCARARTHSRNGL
jgi:hypothetical protein